MDDLIVDGEVVDNAMYRQIFADIATNLQQLRQAGRDDRARQREWESFRERYASANMSEGKEAVVQAARLLLPASHGRRSYVWRMFSHEAATRTGESWPQLRLETIDETMWLFSELMIQECQAVPLQGSRLKRFVDEIEGKVEAMFEGATYPQPRMPSGGASNSSNASAGNITTARTGMITTNSKPKCHFLDLPIELQDRIYEYCSPASRLLSFGIPSTSSYFAKRNFFRAQLKHVEDAKNERTGQHEPTIQNEPGDPSKTPTLYFCSNKDNIHSTNLLYVCKKTARGFTRALLASHHWIDAWSDILGPALPHMVPVISVPEVNALVKLLGHSPELPQLIKDGVPAQIAEFVQTPRAGLTSQTSGNDNHGGKGLLAAPTSAAAILPLFPHSQVHHLQRLIFQFPFPFIGVHNDDTTHEITSKLTVHHARIGHLCRLLSMSTNLRNLTILVAGRQACRHARGGGFGADWGENYDPIMDGDPQAQQKELRDLLAGAGGLLRVLKELMGYAANGGRDDGVVGGEVLKSVVIRLDNVVVERRWLERMVESFLKPARLDGGSVHMAMEDVDNNGYGDDGDDGDSARDQKSWRGTGWGCRVNARTDGGEFGAGMGMVAAWKLPKKRES